MRRIPVAAAVSLALLLVLAVTAELTFGTWFTKDPLDRQGLLRNSTATVAAGTLYPGGYDFIYRRDAWGFRGAGLDTAKITILTMGGSTTNQPTLPDEQTWQAVMEREFRAAGHDVVIANAGIDGQSTVGQVRAFETWLPHVPGLNPRFVLFSVGLDEAQVSGSSLGRGAHSSRAEWVARHSGVVRMAERLLGLIAAPKAAQPQQPVDYAAAQWTDKPTDSQWRPERDAITGYKERLTHLAQLAHGMGAVPVFVTQSRGDFRVVDGKVLGLVGPHGLNGVDHYRRLAEFNHATRDVCKESGLLCLDLAREVSFAAGDFYDHLHNSPQGAEKVGRWLATKLAGLV